MNISTRIPNAVFAFGMGCANNDEQAGHADERDLPHG
jgi:hypothetical protein